jgi:signal transduction histidine kinase
MITMSPLDLLDEIRDGWVARVSQQLAMGAGVRESFLDQVNQFYVAMRKAVETEDPSWIEPILEAWTQAMTVTELDTPGADLSAVLSEMLLATQSYALKGLPPENGMRLMNSLLPVFTHAYKFVSKRESQARVEHVHRELESAQHQLELLDKSKSDFISVAAHELKTPLTLIEGYAAMIREMHPPDDEMSNLVILLKGIDNGTHRLREIVDDMIDVSMIDNNLLSLNFQPLWVNRILDNLAEELRESVEARRQKLIIQPFPGSEEMTFGDPERLFQAFRNLFVNAIKFTPDGGKLIVDGRKLPGFMEITIADTGIGINPEYHTLIFEKFGQLGNVSLHSSGKTKFMGGGPGLGLHITKGLIEAHGGTIWVESEKQDEETFPGSVFHVMLPIRKDPPDDRSARLYQPLMDGLINK